jgi:hypothetical protein
LVAVLVIGGVVTGGSPATVEIDNVDDAEYRVTAYDVPDQVPAFRGTADGQRQPIEWPYRTDVSNLSVVGSSVESESFVVSPEDSVSVELGLGVAGTTVLVVETTDRTERSVGVVVAHCDGGGGQFHGTIDGGRLEMSSWSC